MSRPKVKSKSESIAMMPGAFRLVAIMECGWCGDDIEVEADNEEEAYKTFIDVGVREVDTDGVTGLFCPECVELARENKLDE